MKSPIINNLFINNPNRNNPVSGLLPQEILEKLQLAQNYQAKQIFTWVHSGVSRFGDMTNLSKQLRSRLEQDWLVLSSAIDEELADPDGTVKFRIKLEDGLCIEAVLLTDRNARKTICISSQVGCKMACRFCRTGQVGFIRDLTAYEIVEQFLLVKARYGAISHIVFMGMGEPLDNLGNVRKAIALLTHPDGTAIGLRKITLSTCGMLQGIAELAAGGPIVKLAVSLVSAVQETREQLMPIAAANPLPRLKEQLLVYQARTKKRLTLEIVLLKGINDNEKALTGLLNFIPPLKVVINLIPWNTASGLDFQSPGKKQVEWFRKSLEAQGIAVTQRYRRGTGINAACGQLYTSSLQDCPDTPDTGRG